MLPRSPPLVEKPHWRGERCGISMFSSQPFFETTDLCRKKQVQFMCIDPKRSNSDAERTQTEPRFSYSALPRRPQSTRAGEKRGGDIRNMFLILFFHLRPTRSEGCPLFLRFSQQPCEVGAVESDEHPGRFVAEQELKPRQSCPKPQHSGLRTHFCCLETHSQETQRTLSGRK